jgi:hypothetical protein
MRPDLTSERTPGDDRLEYKYYSKMSPRKRGLKSGFLISAEREFNVTAKFSQGTVTKSEQLLHRLSRDGIHHWKTNCS